MADPEVDPQIMQWEDEGGPVVEPMTLGGKLRQAARLGINSLSGGSNPLPEVLPDNLPSENEQPQTG